MWILLDIVLAVIAIAAVIAVLAVILPPVRWYIFLLLAKMDFIFTEVPESYFKEVVRFGGHRKTIMAKTGHKIDGDGDIMPLGSDEPPESSLPGGLRVVGWPFIDRVYRRQMKFRKSLPEGGIKDYDVPNVDAFYARVDYPYAIPFVDCEDRNNLPISGYATLFANIVNPRKALFATANFYEAMVGLVLPEIRQCLEAFTFDELKEKDDLDLIMWKALNSPNPGGHIDPTGPHDPRFTGSVIEELREIYGIEIVNLRVVNIDPPAEYREISLTKWKAERATDAARAVGQKDAEETEGRVLEAVARSNGLTREELEAKLRADPSLKGKSDSEGGFKEDFKNARDQTKRDRAGAGLRDVRVGNADGTNLEPLTGMVASLISLVRGGDPGGSASGGGGSRGGPGGSRGTPPLPTPTPPRTEAELARDAEDFHAKHGSWPGWDPLHRGG